MVTCQTGDKNSALELKTGHPMPVSGWMLGFYYLVHCILVLGNIQCRSCRVRMMERVGGGEAGAALDQLHHSREP